MRKPIYLCDRCRNGNCLKEMCVDNGGPCYCTIDREFAQLDNEGKPIAVDWADEDDFEVKPVLN